MTLHLVRIGLNLRALAAFAVASGASDDDSGYALHLALRQRFGEAGPQPFRSFVDGPGEPHLLAYTNDRVALTDMAALPSAQPLLDEVFSGPPQLRAMPAEWRAGAAYGFIVRARPVVRFGTRRKAERAASDIARPAENWWARAGEVDAWIAARTRDGGDPDLTRDAAYAAWLTTRLADVATLHGVRLEQFRRVRAKRSPHGRPGRSRVEGPDALLSGTLTITDPAAFAHVLARGVGRHAAFGYGMLLLSPPRRPGGG
jgi:CRISPR system Cascade subunit CasE